mmetsp:Transcript_125328/g.187196  ORF Transcript_125328/g.187196 Transcript_125328/m.187196 type:complete len:194 (+) Transcript_125328:91-672(+)|eukprot:CAMPEP_0117048552 /NCGR_PEP_ID=MMETSP0472-20121206/33561_1 /TAXON_ID=693140 ORGANISM="Tiarina fusus, Strain LIS" /NCGR_SAMPLE_ID=MMETSP0472 /ASSEMBLY_ACC=CAM_ASM_000603 /LENGTH=193 /DNA_ID=CAMNT_0004761693 /DNA_START=91 /DNA_END=672 /DNA_ORIENTATION=-
MGQVCSGTKEESRKGGAFEASDGDDHGVSSNDPQFLDDHPPQQPTSQLDDRGQPSSMEDAERIKALRDEQARLEMIVSTAGRGMVSVRSTRGSTGYYDQGFAAALAQHLEQTTQFPNKLEVRLPPPSSASAYDRLNQPQWDGIALGTGGGLAGCGGENPMGYMDNVAESLLDSVVPAKQQLFAGVSPMVENLL